MRDWGFDPVVIAAILTAMIASTVSLVMAVLIMGFRFWRGRVEQHEKECIAEWEPALFAAMDSLQALKMPTLSRPDLAVFLELWTHLQEVTRGAATENLNRFLNDNIPVSRIIGMLKHGGMRHRVVAVTALGHLQSRAAIGPLTELVAEPQPILSYAAMRALLRIDSGEMLPQLVPMILSRADWPISRLSALFRELGANVITGPLLDKLLTITKAEALRLLPLLALCHSERVDPAVRAWMTAQDDPELIAAGLEFMRAPQDIPVLLAAANHADWRVRAAAASGLGEVGGAAEQLTLQTLLSDRAWWVRYRSAKALVTQRGPNDPRLGLILLTTTDNFAREILQQVMAEVT